MTLTPGPERNRADVEVAPENRADGNSEAHARGARPAPSSADTGPSTSGHVTGRRRRPKAPARRPSLLCL